MGRRPKTADYRTLLPIRLRDCPLIASCLRRVNGLFSRNERYLRGEASSWRVVPVEAKVQVRQDDPEKERWNQIVTVCGRPVRRPRVVIRRIAAIENGGTERRPGAGGSRAERALCPWVS